MSKGSSIDSDEDELFIDVEEDQHHRCCRGLTPLRTGGGVGVAGETTVLSLQAMVDAVVDCVPVESPSSSSAMSSSSVVIASSATSSPRCSPSLCHRRPASPTSPAADKTLTRRSILDSRCCDEQGRRRLPDVVQLPSAVCAERRHRRSFLIEEILRPDFGRRRAPASANSQQKQFPAEVGVNHVTSIWQPFSASPSRTAVVDAVCRQDTKECRDIRTTTTKAGGDRNKKSVKRKSQGGHVDTASNCATGQSTTQRQISLARHSSPRSSSSSTSSSESGSGSDVSAVRTESSTNVATGQSDVPASKYGQLALPAWVFCTRYSDRPSSGIYSAVHIIAALSYKIES